MNVNDQYFFPTDEICTNVSIPACGSSATDCKPIGENNEALKTFRQIHPDVYAEECKETSDSGHVHCLYTDVTYDTCSVAKTSEFLSKCDEKN